MSYKNFTLTVLGALVCSVIVLFFMQQPRNQNSHNGHAALAGMPIETGQSAFAAIAEIVRLLEEDANTDWEKVNIARLRNHLVDMNQLTLNADVELKSDNTSIEFVITGEGSTIDAVKAMVPAHAKELDKMAGWSALTYVETNGVRLVMTPVSTKERTKILALGFFGLMATGAHHQPHHLGMATGKMIH